MSLTRANYEIFGDSELYAGFNEADNTWEVIVKFNGDLSRIEDELGAVVEILSHNLAIITIHEDRVNDLYLFSEIEFIEKPKKLLFVQQNANERSCITIVQSSLSFNLRGAGVLVAIIDSGIDYTHPDFRNADGTSRILYFWDQYSTETGREPQNFRHGVEYDNSDLNEALNQNQPFTLIPELDTIGHGTAVAGIAAGNGRASEGYNIGAAPESSIIGVRLGRRGERSFVRNTELMRGVKYCIDKALSLNMPISINISYGTNLGSHDGRSLFELFIDEMAQRWKTSIITATGNEGHAGHHASGKLRSNETNEITFVTHGWLRSFYVSFWKNFVDDFTVELVLPNRSSTGEISAVSPIRSIRFGNIAVYVEYGQPNHYNENQEIFFQINAINRYLPAGIWRLIIRTGIVVEGDFNIWLPVTEDVSLDTRFLKPDPLNTITLPATAAYCISVGAYNHHIDSFADFSGRGGFLSGKPDLAAPGVNIISARIGGGYDSFTGTSMAAPFVTGSAALMMQWGIVEGNDPFLYGQRIKAFLKFGALRDRGRTYPNPEWGFGRLCLRNSMNELVRYQQL